MVVVVGLIMQADINMSLSSAFITVRFYGFLISAHACLLLILIFTTQKLNAT